MRWLLLTFCLTNLNLNNMAGTKFLSILSLLLFSNAICAQLLIQPGASIRTTGNPILVLHNINAFNNDPASQLANTTLRIEGNQVNRLSGSSTWTIRNLSIDKTSGKLELDSDVQIIDSLHLRNGILDLKDYRLRLLPQANLWGENNDNHILASGSGWMETSRQLSSPVEANPGNLGLVISSPAQLGEVLIRRGHTALIDSANQGALKRYYQVIPANNQALTAGIRFTYLEPELGHLAEATLYLQQSENRQNWQVVEGAFRDISSNMVTATGLSQLHYFTLAPAAQSPLPVFWGLLQARCEADYPQIQWQTLQEWNTHHFAVERSSQGSHWIKIGELPAAGESGNTRNYSWSDATAAAGSAYQYRIRSVDVDGREQLSPIVLVHACTLPIKLDLSPVPAGHTTVLSLHAEVSGRAFIRLIGNDGRIHQNLQMDIVAGNNQRVLDVSRLAAGVYFVQVEWGATKQTLRLLVRRD